MRKRIMKILQDYDVLLMDLWGVVYDGEHLYPGVIEALQSLEKLKKDVIFLSNVPRRKSTITQMLAKFNIKKPLYTDITVSGEFVNELLSKKKSFGTKYFYLGSPESEEVVLDLKDYKRVNHPKDADFSIITSIINYYDEAMKLAQKAIEYKLPLICTNPDKSSIKKNGEVVFCPGVIADKYEKLGGEVFYFGKPYKHIYEYALRNISDHKRVLAIGDSMAHDVKGARNVNLDSVLVCSGIHRHDLEIGIGDVPSEKKLMALCKKYSVQPTFVLSLLKDLVS